MQENTEDPLPSGQPTLLVINSGSPKKRFIFQKLKKLPVRIVVVNKDRNWVSSYADDMILADTSNHSEVLRMVGEYLHQHPLNGVITFWEDDVLLTSKIAERYNLVGIPFQVAKLARNKYAFRQFCREQGLPAPKFFLVRSQSDLPEAIKNLQFPLVIKPAFGSSSALVVRVNDQAELEDAFSYVQQNLSITTESSLKEGNDIFLEEYIDGDEVDIDMILQNGKVKYASIADNYSTAEPFFIETTHALPSNLPSKSKTQLVQMAEEVLERLGVQYGCIHFEAKITSHGPVPLEANLRMGGDEIYLSNKKVWGVDLIEEAVNVALGNYIQQKEELKPKQSVMTHAFHATDSGMISALHIDKEALKTARVEQLYIGKDVGDPIFVPPDGYEYLGWVTVSGENFLDVQDNLKKAIKAVSYDVVKFDQGSFVGKTKRKNRFSVASLRKNWNQAASKIEHIRQIPLTEQRSLHIGIAGNAYSGEAGAVEDELASVGQTIQQTLSKLGYQTTFIDFNNLPQALELLKSKKIDFVFNVCERINNSSLLEPHATAIFDVLQIPYTGSNPFTLGLCIDKIKVKKLLTYHNIPTPQWDYAYSMDDQISDELRYPLIVKPANSDNSIGITNESVVEDKKALQRQLEKIIVGMKRPALVEEYIAGDEYDVSILGSEEDDVMVLPLARTVFDKLPNDMWHIYPYESKFGDGTFLQKYLTVQQPPKNVPAKLTSLITEIALDTYNILDCHDYGRVEIKCDQDNNPYVLELNPNPSINQGNRVPLVAEMIGLDYPAFIEKIITLAIKRYQGKPAYYHLQTGLT